MRTFLHPTTPEETLLLKQIAHIVQEQYSEIYHNTSKQMQAELSLLVVRTMWDNVQQDRYGEYFGVPAPKQGPFDTGMMPSEIVIFARPLSAQYSGTALIHKIRLVLVHEIGHYLGLSEEDLRKRNLC